MANSTFEDVLNRTLVLMAETDQSTTFNEATVGARINVRYKDMCKGEIIRYFADEKGSRTIKAKSLPFLDQKTPINWTATTSLTADASVGDTTLYLDTTNISASPAGAIYVKGCVITFTGKTATSLTGCAGVVAALSLGEVISEVYPVAGLSMYKPVSMDLQDGTQQIPVPYIRKTDYHPTRYFTVLNEGPTKYIYMVGCETGLYRLNFVLAPDTLTLPADELLLPEDTGVNTLAPIVAGELLWEAEEIEFGREKLEAGYTNCIAFYEQFNSDIAESPQQISYSFTTPYDTV